MGSRTLAVIAEARRDGRNRVYVLRREGLLPPDEMVLDDSDPITGRVLGLDD